MLSLIVEHLGHPLDGYVYVSTVFFFHLQKCPYLLKEVDPPWPFPTWTGQKSELLLGA